VRSYKARESKGAGWRENSPGNPCCRIEGERILFLEGCGELGWSS
ncbi:hypothetical protein LEMLEM_LOCUS17266, partial [Lemmus lemmus]